MTSTGQKCLPAKLTLKSDPRDAQDGRGELIPVSCGTHRHTPKHTKCQRGREEKVDPESQSLVRAFADMEGSAAPTQSMEALPHAEHTPQETSQAWLHKHSVRLTRLHLTWVRQDAGNVHITQSSPGLVEWGQGLVYTEKG